MTSKRKPLRMNSFKRVRKGIRLPAQQKRGRPRESGRSRGYASKYRRFRVRRKASSEVPKKKGRSNIGILASTRKASREDRPVLKERVRQAAGAGQGVAKEVGKFSRVYENEKKEEGVSKIGKKRKESGVLTRRAEDQSGPHRGLGGESPLDRLGQKIAVAAKELKGSRKRGGYVRVRGGR